MDKAMKDVLGETNNKKNNKTTNEEEKDESSFSDYFSVSFKEEVEDARDKGMDQVIKILLLLVHFVKLLL
jgi:hypothetical protein